MDIPQNEQLAKYLADMRVLRDEQVREWCGLPTKPEEFNPDD